MLLILFWIFPSNGVKVSNVELNFFSKEDFQKEKLITKVASEIPAPIVINSDSINKVKKNIQDSLENILLLEKKRIKEALILSQKNIQYPNGDPSVLIPFFKKLENAKFKKVRIMHYGDSQIEGDRISED